MFATKKTNVSYRAFHLSDGLPAWYEDHVVSQDDGHCTSWVRKAEEGWEVQTLEGLERADNDDWCVEGAKGEYYPMSEKSFFERYKPSSDGRWERIATPVECWLFSTTDVSQMPDWVRLAIQRALINVDGDSLIVHASWGDQLATLGNDVLMHASDEDIYPCKRDVFELTYDVVS